MMTETLPITAYINTVTDFSQDRLHATLSCHMYNHARGAIKRFFDDPTMTDIIYGWSSGQLRSHILYRHSDGIIYVVHFAYGEYRDAFYFTKSELMDYFEDFEDEMPDFQESEFVQQQISQQR
tara:strand:+ start:372 stop:740 length:369 start_codon:yes stop_codon:yes gene_type:complete